VTHKPNQCDKWRPSLDRPELCRWWMVAPESLETKWEPFCCYPGRLDMECPTMGQNPYGDEEDSFE